MMVLEEKTMQKAAVIGHPIVQSLSPLIHKHWFSETGIDGDYTAIDVPAGALESQLEFFKNEGYAGFNVTVPYKTDIIPLLDKLAPLARQMGAVNTVKINPDGTTTGFNTDGIGLMQHLKLSAPSWLQDKPVLVLGAGGAARAACLGLLNSNVPMIMIANRTRKKAEIVAGEIGRGRIVTVDWDDRESALSGAGLVVNTTVLGMMGQLPLDLDLSQAAAGTIVYDIVYKPLQTDLLKRAGDQGLFTIDGLGMLVHQGAAAFKIWFGVDVGFDNRLRTKLNEALS